LATLQFLAGQFTLPDGAAVDAVQGWMRVLLFGAGTIDIHIRADDQGLPGRSIFSKRYSLGPQNTFDWVTFADYAVALDPGTYWLSFEPAPSGGLQAAIGQGALSPLAEYAYFVDGNGRWLTFRSIGSQPALAMRVSGTAFTAAERIERVSAIIQSIGLESGIAHGFDAKLTAAQSALANDDRALGCSALQDLINALSALSAKKITAADAARIIAYVTGIRAALEC
jgi:hypothetical protein